MSPGIDALASMARAVTAAPKVAEVAAATTKAVEVAAVVPKAAEIAATASQTLAGGIEAGLGDAHATLGHLAELKTELPPPAIGTVPESTTSPTALNANTLEGVTAPVETGAKPVESVTTLTPDKNITSDEAALSGIEKATVEAETAIEKSVMTKAEQWDNEHPQPDANTDPEKFNDWVRERASAQTSAREDATVNAALHNWDKENPAPDKTKDPEAFNKWVEERADQEKSLKKEVSGKEGDKTNKEGQKQELSAAEIAKRVKRINELGIQIAEINDGIKAIRSQPDKNNEDKIRLAEFTVRRDQKVAEVMVIKAELGDAVTKASPIKKIALISALITAAGVMMAAQASKS